MVPGVMGMLGYFWGMEKFMSDYDFYDRGFGKLKFRVEVIILEPKDQSHKY